MKLLCVTISLFDCRQYITIQDPEQRKRYKTDFNADYAEYKSLHGIVEKVSRRFAQLEERLKQEGENSPKYKVSSHITTSCLNLILASQYLISFFFLR